MQMEELEIANEPNLSMNLQIEENENVKKILEGGILGNQSLLTSELDENADNHLYQNKGHQNKISPKCLLEGENYLELKISQDWFYKEGSAVPALIDSNSDDVQEKFSEVYIEPRRILKLGEEDDARKECFNIKNSKLRSNLQRKKLENLINTKPKSLKNGVSVVDTGDEFSTEIYTSDRETQDKEVKFAENNENSMERHETTEVVRVSVNTAMDEIQAIQSEQQRLHREAYVSIPYHKPRKYTLEDFLKRRTIIQPQNASPVAAVIKAKNLKMTAEELEEYAKLMEERAQEAAEFFKSESDNQVAAVEEITDDSQNKIEVVEKSQHQNNAVDEFSTNENKVQLTEDGLKDVLAVERMSQVEKEQEKAAFPKVLIRDVIELPKLDMNIVQISSVKKHLLAEKVLSERPSLTGDPNKLIDLETGNSIEKEPTGMENLMKRLMATFKVKKAKRSETSNILSFAENGKPEISNVNTIRSEVQYPEKEIKPGAAFFQLKRNLKNIITKKRLEEKNKKQNDELEYSKCLVDEDSEAEDEILGEKCDADGKLEGKVVWLDEEQNYLKVKDGIETSRDEEYAESKIEDEGVENNSEYANKDEENTLGIISRNKSERKCRIITIFDNSDEEGKNDDIDFLKTQSPTTAQSSVLETQSSIRTSLEENQLMRFCSVTFDDAIKQSANCLLSQIPTTQNYDKPVNYDELIALCSGTFDKTAITQNLNEIKENPDGPKTKCSKILSSDEQTDEEPKTVGEGKIGKIKKRTKRQKKRKAKLGFSDDEDDEERNHEEYDEGNVNLNDFETDAEDPETFIDYDSDENEILVKMTRDDKVKQALNFFENEAELSESEWGSADEDENNIDKYDIELGDEDEFDKEQLRTELGQIHARKMLDEDIREVRKMQELLFEDEEGDGVGRQRTFKWKNAESGFSLEDVDGGPLNEGNQNGESGDEVNEHQWRKMRYERELFLKEQGLEPNEMSTVLAKTSKPLNNVVSDVFASKNLQTITKKAVISSLGTKEGSPFLISKSFATMHKKSVRGSFLVRDKETLNKLTGLTKGPSPSVLVSNMDDTTGTVSIKSVRPTNFVFATLTNEEHENKKRKADEFLNRNNGIGKDYMKKSKLEPRRDKCFIDHLL